MGIYRDYILPWFTDWTLNTPEFRQLRRRIMRGLGGDGGTVLEIGFGSGLNLPHLPGTVQRFCAVDPCVFGRRLAARRIRACPIPVEFIGLDGAELPLEAESVDAVLTTWTLCSVADLPRMLGEIRRVLKPGGRYHFLEHGLSPDVGVARWQHRMNPIEKVIGGGCQLIVPIAERVRAAGFSMASLDNFYVTGPKFLSYMYEGVAVPEA
jgi:ubiquinone/menaquinone biosynthesis C-methylase UbiE